MHSLRSSKAVDVVPTNEAVAKAMKEATKIKCAGGSLSYQGSIPHLKITAKTAEEAGYAHGYILAEPIFRVIETVTTQILASIELPMGITIDRSTLTKMLNKKVMDGLWKQIPAEYQKELDGIVSGYNKRLEEGAFKGDALTRNDIILFHLMGDKQHYDMMKNLITVGSAMGGIFTKLFGCTSIIGGDKETGPIFGRNLDWPSYGCLADASMIISRISFETGKNIVEVGLPGFAGTLTGVNEDGLSLAMNVCDGDTQKIEGMMAGFYNRKILETCPTTAKVAEFVAKNNPFGPYHLTVADPNSAAVHHLKQDEKGKHITREKGDAAILETTNCRYSAKKGKVVAGEDEYQSKERRSEIGKHFKRKDNQKHNLEAIESALKLPSVNMSETLHAIVMVPKEMKMKLAVANGNAASKELQTLDLKQLFIQNSAKTK